MFKALSLFIVFGLLMMMNSGITATESEQNQQDEDHRIAVRGTIKSLSTKYLTDEKRLAIIKDNIPSDSKAALEELFIQLQKVEDIRTINAIRHILKDMEFDIGSLIAKKLESEEDPFQKGKLLRALRDYDGKEVIKALIKQLEDKRIMEKRTPEHDGPSKRVCDYAYRVIIQKLDLEKEGFHGWVPATYGEERDKPIEELEAYWEKNGSSILERLETKEDDLEEGDEE